MQNALEFIAEKKVGGMIEIPKEYVNEVSGEFRVILILNVKPRKKSRKREFNAFKVNTQGFTFNRDEMYDE